MEFNRTGITIDTFDDIYNRFANGLKAIYGDDIDLSQNTPDGQRVGITTKEVLDIQTVVGNLYNNLDIDTATGAMEAVIGKIAGVEKLPATRSTAELTIITDRDLTLPSGYIVSDVSNQEWITENEYTLVSGTNTVSFVAKEWGKVEAAKNEINIPVTIVIGVVSASNPAAAVSGRDEETDEQFRRRRNKSLENASHGTIGGLIAKIAAINGVTDVVGYENKASTQDSVRDMPPHSIWLVVEGGDVAEIAETMAKNKAGATEKGSTTGTYVETVERPTNDFYITHTMSFDRPQYINLHVKLNAKRKVSSQPVDKDLIKKKIAGRQFTIAEDLEASELYADVYQAGINFTAYDLKVSTDGSSYTDQNVKAGYNGKFVISESNIDVTEVQ